MGRITKSEEVLIAPIRRSLWDGRIRDLADEWSGPAMSRLAPRARVHAVASWVTQFARSPA